MSTQDFSLASEIAGSHAEYLREADELLREIVGSGRKPNYPESVFFQQRCGWDEIRQNKELRRMTNVLRNQAIAATASDREAALKEAESAAVVAEKELPKLSSKIAELQAKADGLERDARLSAKRCQEQTDAVSKLRDLCPEDVAGSVQANVQAIESTLGRELRDAETRAHELQCCLSRSLYKSEPEYLEVLERSFRPAVLRVEERGVFKRKLSPEWPGIKASIQSELAELQTRQVELKTEYAEAIAAAEKPLSHYAN